LKIDKLLHLALFLFTTPSYSIVYYVIGKYVPNHIFGYLIILAIVLSKRSIRIDPLKLLLSMGLIVYVILTCTYNSFLNTTTLHFIFIVLCLCIINKEIKIESALIRNLVIFQFFIAVTQTFLMNFGFEEIVHSLKTYPTQIKDDNHLIQKWFYFFYRVGGGFKESSQLAAFMVICLFLNENCKTTKLLGTIGILITGSMLGFIGLILFTLINVKNYFYKIILVSMSIILAIPLVIWRVTYSKLFNAQNEEMGSDRFYNLYLSLTGYNFSFLGNGINYYRGNDFLSLYMPSVGILGVCLIILYLCYYFVIMNKYSGLILTFLIFLCINGSIQEVPYQFMFILLSVKLFTGVKKKGYFYENC
jgi:hypothetical protein